MKWLNFHHLLYFREIARQGSLSKASKVLNVGQPALSAQLKTLESQLEIKLFERKNRSLVLTEAGKVTLDYANQINDTGQEFTEVIHKRGFSKRIRLNAGALNPIPKHLVSNVLDYVHRKTNCFLSISEGNPDYLLRELESHNLDVIFSDHNLRSDNQGKILSKKILRMKVNAYAHLSYKNLKKKFPQSLRQIPCILPSNLSQLRSDLEHYFHVQKIYVDRIGETEDLMLQKILGAKGDGIIFLPEFAAKDFVEEGKIIKIGELKDVFVEYFLIYSKRLIDNPALELLLRQNFEKMKLGN